MLLMDEPLSNLDALLRLNFRAELKRLVEELRTTTIYVTHDQVEALSLGDRIAVMRAGRIVQVGAPLDVYDAPGRPIRRRLHRQPADELPRGHAGAARGRDRRQGRVGRRGVDRDPPDGLTERLGRSILLGIRAENIDVVSGGSPDGLLRGRALVVEPLGSHNLVTIDVAGQLVKATTRPEVTIDRDAEVGLRLDGARLRWIDPESGRALDRDAASGTPTAAVAG